MAEQNTAVDRKSHEKTIGEKQIPIVLTTESVHTS